MWPKLAFRILPFFFLSACSPTDRQAADKLNSSSYACHYRSLDSAEYYANKAFDLSVNYDDGKAEALNNLAFVRLAQMRYNEAEYCLKQIEQTTDNQLELLICYIQQMRLCQRTSQNRSFYDYRTQASVALNRLYEEIGELNERQRGRLLYAESELAIVTSTYYYYLGLERQAKQALDNMPDGLQRDTTQYLNYLYNIGSGGIIDAETQEIVNQQEFDYLMRCFLLARQTGVSYFTANSLEALAEHLMVNEYRRKLMDDNLPAMKFLNPNNVNSDSLPLLLAEEALRLFQNYGDVYQIAGAHRNLASCYLSEGNYEHALYQLHMALADSTINQAPDLVASIREQLSVAYAAIDDKPNSDYNRNQYLDLQEQTRQDRQLEARAGQLERSIAQLNILIAAVVAAIIFLAILLGLFFYRSRKRHAGKEEESQQSRKEELQEELELARFHLEKEKRLNLEQRSKVSLVNSIMPLIDRIMHEVTKLSDDEERREESLQYIRELADKINEQNDILTHWIQLRQGELSLHIESFPLQPLFDTVARGRAGFNLKNISLSVVPTSAYVKADKVLTLFMINTLADNARKFTPSGGSVTIEAVEKSDSVEIAIMDTGIGMDREHLNHLFDHKPIIDQKNYSLEQSSHGFGLLNCNGIIEKYRKLSPVFSVCKIDAESTNSGEKRGSRFFFYLPKGMRKTLVVLSFLTAFAGENHAYADDAIHYLSIASNYADSTYHSNVDGSYARTLDYADSCRHYLNMYYKLMAPNQPDTLQLAGDPSLIAPEIIWLHDSIRINYDIILTFRNETAVAALAQHEWALYHYNNRIYTQLFKELSADSTLDDYCKKMQQSQTNKQIAILLLVVIFVSILFIIAWQVIVALGKAARRQQVQFEEMAVIADVISKTKMDEAGLHISNAILDNCLSTLKHETMYYPSRIKMLADTGDYVALAEVTTYYRELYAILNIQSFRQIENSKLHPTTLEHDILGDPTLISFLFEIIQKQAGSKHLDIAYKVKNDKYVQCEVRLPSVKLTEQQAEQLFTPTIENIPYMLCRQIVRDHGEATNRRGCAIMATIKDNNTFINITLPRIWKNSKLSS